jgi:hypothetical protein
MFALRTEVPEVGGWLLSFVSSAVIYTFWSLKLNIASIYKWIGTQVKQKCLLTAIKVIAISVDVSSPLRWISRLSDERLFLGVTELGLIVRSDK